MILADTSIWVEHLSRGNPRLAAYLEDGRVLCHPFVIGELACGRMKHRSRVLGLLSRLPSAAVAGHGEVLAMIDEHRLDGVGLGWVDVHLLTASRLTGCVLWTADKALKSAAAALGVSA